jgi:hypothetical protein
MEVILKYKLLETIAVGKSYTKYEILRTKYQSWTSQSSSSIIKAKKKS